MSRQPNQKKNWTVESCEDNVEFHLIYYRVRESEDWPHKIEDIPYNPVEYIREKEAVEGGKTIDDSASSTTVPPSRSSTQPNQNTRNGFRAVPSSQAPPRHTLPRRDGMDRNFNPPTAPRAMINVELNRNGGEQRALTSSGAGRRIGGSRGVGSSGN
jgi:hypothetical protein